jgi:GMP synthase (glutamine-hydrolysing)
MENQRILILNFGGQYDQLIARRVRECHVYCEVKPYTMTLSEIQAFDPIGIIFTGGPDSVYKDNSYHPAEGIFELGLPILGICYGCQLLAHHLGGLVMAAEQENAREYGKTRTFYDTSCLLFD